MGRLVAASICVALCLTASACNRSDAPAEPAAAASTSPSPAPAAAAPSAVSGAATTDPECANICRNTLALHCSKAAACVENCQGMVQSGVCSELVHAVLACFGKQQLERWECDEEGNAAIKDGFCDAEQAAFARCAQSH